MNSTWFPKWVVLTIILLSGATVWLRLFIVRTSYELGQVNQMLQNQLQEKQNLELEVANLSSPRRLEKIAKQRFNLKPPTKDQLIQLRQENGKK